MNERAFRIAGEKRPSRWLITCDHATNRVPHWVNGGDLGIAAADMSRHIAYDIGAAGLAEHLARRLDAAAILSDFSRLVIDPNRGEDDPTLLMRLYDGTVIPANRQAGPAERQRRLERLYRPYHAALEHLASQRPACCLCAVHSFTPQLRGRPPRPWQVGILYSHKDARLGPAMVQACRDEGWVTGDNQPYAGHLDGDSIDRHALAQGRPNMLIEIRNDLIASEAGQIEWAGRLAPVITRVLAATGL
ncbi:N-formylglutamate amidohydrolase [Paracoccus marinaquae]|uniref:N-formylglutamate amidohydrolase n=1 Tax=Paracoccus marinaquae TaxID=2841926 RepID=A0ABS6AJR9_9RHOB|nr:N-formylglutamate amidohydrolase [Paracoccus marinaquae]MBU3030833.1 N-formylglutamate amidohydrolase [Paracoccus marinaquae]